MQKSANNPDFTSFYQTSRKQPSCCRGFLGFRPTFHQPVGASFLRPPRTHGPESLLTHQVVTHQAPPSSALHRRCVFSFFFVLFLVLCFFALLFFLVFFFASVAFCLYCFLLCLSHLSLSLRPVYSECSSLVCLALSNGSFVFCAWLVVWIFLWLLSVCLLNCCLCLCGSFGCFLQ